MVMFSFGGVKVLEKKCPMCRGSLGEQVGAHLCAGCREWRAGRWALILKYPRLAGGIFLIIAGGALKLVILDVLELARAHQVLHLGRGVFCVIALPLIFVYGICLLFGGNPAAQMLIRAAKSREPGQPITIKLLPYTLLTAGVALLSWFFYELHTNGYSVWPFNLF
jgi:hypothetical protein